MSPEKKFLALSKQNPHLLSNSTIPLWHASPHIFTLFFFTNWQISISLLNCDKETTSLFHVTTSEAADSSRMFGQNIRIGLVYPDNGSSLTVRIPMQRFNTHNGQLETRFTDSREIQKSESVWKSRAIFTGEGTI